MQHHELRQVEGLGLDACRSKRSVGAAHRSLKLPCIVDTYTARVGCHRHECGCREASMAAATVATGCQETQDRRVSASPASGCPTASASPASCCAASASPASGCPTASASPANCCAASASPASGCSANGSSEFAHGVQQASADASSVIVQRCRPCAASSHKRSVQPSCTSWRREADHVDSRRASHGDRFAHTFVSSSTKRFASQPGGQCELRGGGLDLRGVARLSPSFVGSLRAFDLHTEFMLFAIVASESDFEDSSTLAPIV